MPITFLYKSKYKYKCKEVNNWILNNNIFIFKKNISKYKLNMIKDKLIKSILYITQKSPK